MRKIQTLGIILAVVMLCGSIPIGFSEPLKEQLEKGIKDENIQCDNSSHVLVQRNNGKLACVSERTAEKMEWDIIENKINSAALDVKKLSNDVKIMPTEKQLYDNTSSVLIKSTGEFVPKDKPNGSYSEMISTQRSPAPMTHEENSVFGFEKIIRFDSDGNIFQQEAVLDNNFPISQSSPGDNTTKPRTFIIDQWMPTVIPNGYELKIITWSGPFEGPVSVFESLTIDYAPADEILTPQNYTSTVHDIQGFVIGGNYKVSNPNTDSQIQDYIDKLLSYGEWRESTVLGKRTLVADLTDEHRSAVRIITSDYEFGVTSYYHTLSELTEILESIPALQQ